MLGFCCCCFFWGGCCLIVCLFFYFFISFILAFTPSNVMFFFWSDGMGLSEARSIAQCWASQLTLLLYNSTCVCCQGHHYVHSNFHHRRTKLHQNHCLNLCLRSVHRRLLAQNTNALMPWRKCEHITWLISISNFTEHRKQLVISHNMYINGKGKNSTLLSCKAFLPIPRCYREHSENTFVKGVRQMVLAAASLNWVVAALSWRADSAAAVKRLMLPGLLQSILQDQVWGLII